MPRNCHWFFLLILCVGACLSLGTAHADPAYPVKVSPTGRYLVDQDGVPFLMAGESPQAMIGNLSLAEAELFLQNRRAHGFNTVLIDLLCATYTGCRAEGTTFDGIVPFLATLGAAVPNGTTAYDLTQPNPAYFARADAIIQLAVQYGFLVLLDPIEAGSWLEVLQVNGTTRARTFGQLVGQRYKDVPNILWFHGNDYGPPNFDLAQNDPLVTAVALGIKDVDAVHLHTVLLNTGGNLPPALSSDDPRWLPIIDLNAAYTYHATYKNVLDGYNYAAPTMPVFMGETGYEFEGFAEFGTSPQALRAQEYWTLLSGATGQVYGNKFTWPFASGWQTQLDTPGAVQIGFLMNLFTPRRWYDLVPDQTHTVVSADWGTFGQPDYVTAAQTPDGTLAMAYVPSARTLTVNLATMAGPTTARWYDPTSGTFRAIVGSPFAGTGPLGFVTPRANADGDADWVLVLEATVAPVPTLTSISPAQVTAGSPDFTLTATGTAFDQTSVIRVNGTARPTTFVSATQLTATIAAADVSVPGTVSITVATPSAGASSGMSLLVQNPPPVLTALDPGTAAAGGSGFTLTVTGSAFAPSSVVRWNGADRVTTFGGPTTLSATIPASDLTAAGTAAITVFTPTPGGGTSATASLSVQNAAPSMTGVTPTSVIVGDPGFTLTVTGANFTAASVVRWNGADRMTTFVGSTVLDATILASDLSAAGSAAIAVVTPEPGGGIAMGPSVAVLNPVPVVSGVDPGSAIVGGPDLVLTVTGSNFLPSSVIQWNGVARATTFLGATQLRTEIVAADLAAAGSATISVVTPGPGGGASGPLSLSVLNPPPAISGLDPSSATVGAAGFTLAVTGASFVPSSVVNWNGAPRATTYGGPTSLSATIPASDLTVAGVATVTVATPAPGGGSTTAMMVTLVPPPPSPAPVPSPAPAPPTLMMPEGQIATPLAAFAWSAVTTAVQYMLSVDDSTGSRISQRYAANEAGCASGNGVCFVAPGVALAPGPAQWRVQTASASGDGTWSGPMAFTVATTGPAFPVKVGPTNRYLVDQNGVPFLMAGESPQAMIGNLSLVEADLFLQNRRAHGFNTVLIDLLCATYTGCRAEGTTFDGIVPFLATLPDAPGPRGTTVYDLTKPNPDYFARADAIIQLAVQYGFLVLLDPIETGSWLEVLQANKATRARTFGQWVGQRYKNVPNILWFHGNDYGPPNFDLDLNDPLVTAVALGIKDHDTVHLHTVLLNTGGALPSVLSSDDPAWRPIIDINTAYTYHATHQNIIDGYNHAAPTMPVFMGETGYEFETLAEFGTAPAALRAQEHWAILSGATGQVYGNKFTWPFASGWQDQLDSPGAVQMAFLMNLFTPRRWYDLVPDQTHTVVTNGFGTFTQPDYVTVAQTSDGALAMAYVPSARTLTVDLSTMAGPTTARWYDPTSGSLVAVDGSPFASTGPTDFATPGANADGDADWVLVLEATVTPALTSISPTQVTAGGPDFTLTVNGKRFDPTSVVRVNGSARPTNFVSVSKLTAQVSASDIVVAGTLSITVFTPGATLSNAATLSVRNPVPSLAAIDPTRTLQGSDTFTLTVTGNNFTLSSVVRWKGSPRDTHFVSPTELSAEIPAGDLTTAGTAAVTVFTPLPGGGTSTTAATFTVDAPGRVAFANSTATVDETVASVTLPVTRTAGVGGPVTVDYATADGTAHAAEDYDARSGTLTFGVGVTTQTIVVPIHFTPGGGTNETFTVTLSNAQSGLVVGTPATSTVTVRNLNTTLTSFTPAQGAVGTLVTLTGANLSLTTAVSFGGIDTSAITVLSPTSIRVAVPAGATTGHLVVMSSAGNPVSVALFKVLPKITSVTPDDGRVGDMVTITGSNLAGATAVRFGAALAGINASYSTLTTTVPAVAVTGVVSVTTPDGTATSPAPFVVIRAPTITSFTPTIAPEGALVTLNGANLASVVGVSFNSVNASPVTIVSATSIRAVVPTGATTGRLTASNPAGTATSLADFKVAPRILTMTPAQGAPGTPVVITGTTFTGGTGLTGIAATVRFGSIVAGNVSVDGPTTITAMVPATAPTGRISVTTPAGTATSTTDFTVIRPPTITSFTPLAGPVGTAVTISGANLGSVTSVSLNGVDASPVTVLSPTSVRVIVPLTATTGKIAVANPTGPATSAAVFAVSPAITSLTPTRGIPGTSGTPGTGGIPGTSVVIAGSTFDGVTAVRFGSVPAPFTGNSSQITVTVPPTAMSGVVSLTTPFGTAVSGTPFTVVRAPVLSSLSPARGAVGSTLTLSGANIGTVTTVIFNSSGNGNVSAITVLSASSVRVVVPEGAVTGRIGVTNEAGVATSATDFVLTPRLDSMSPARAIPGSPVPVTLTGFNFDGATAVRFGAVPVTSLPVGDATHITVAVPPTAVTGKVSVTTPTGTATSVTDFIVVRAPTITSFSPATGPEGTLVTLTGANLAGASSVAFNGANVTALTIVSASSIRVVVPAGVATGKLGVANEAGSALSAGTFTVAPRIAQIPAADLPGAAVTITGTSLGNATAVRFGGVASAFTVDGPTQVTSTVPSSAVSGKITVTSPGGTASSPTDFTVIRPPVVSALTPTSAQVGALVTLSGTNLGSVTAVGFGNVSATSITVLSASSIRVAVPAGATTGRLTVTNPAGSAQSAGTFVLMPRLTGFGTPSGSDDDAVTLVGTGLTGATVVKFGTVSAAFTVVSDTEITAIIPAAAVTGRVSVTTPGGTTLSPTDFVITAPAPS